MKKIISVLAFTVTFLSACVTSRDPMQNYEKFKSNSNLFSVIQTNDNALNEIQKSVKNINTKVNSQLNNYYKATQNNSLYNEFIAEVQKVRSAKRDITVSEALLHAENALIAYHNISSNDVDKAVNQGLSLVNRLNPASKIQELTSIVNELNSIKSNLGKIKTDFNLNDSANLTKIRAATSVTEQIIYCLDATQFLINQYQSATLIK